MVKCPTFGDNVFINGGESSNSKQTRFEIVTLQFFGRLYLSDFSENFQNESGILTILTMNFLISLKITKNSYFARLQRYKSMDF